MLFSNIERNEHDQHYAAESSFHYLDRSARLQAQKVRERLESWFNDFPTEHQPDIRGRFQANEEIQHISATFELYLYKMLTTLGYNVEIHPRIEGSEKHPDFLAVDQNGRQLYVEATCAVENSVQTQAADRRTDRILERINEIQIHDGVLQVHIRSAPTCDIPARRVVQAVSEWVDSIPACDRQTSDSQGRPQQSFRDTGFHVDIAFIGRGISNNNGAIGFLYKGFRWSGLSNSIRSSLLKKKPGVYGDLNAPYLVALNSGSFRDASSNLTDALLGTEGVSVPIDEPHSEGTLYREPDGVWFRGEPRHTRMSGILFCRDITPWSGSVQ